MGYIYMFLLVFVIVGAPVIGFSMMLGYAIASIIARGDVEKLKAWWVGLSVLFTLIGFFVIFS